ncbi:MAG: hypothetical protein ACI9PN_001456 [Candidatus Azotimanducaceae bacterium]|jgi:hypothetical protein
MQNFDARASYERVENCNAKDLASFEFEEKCHAVAFTGVI